MKSKKTSKKKTTKKRAASKKRMSKIDKWLKRESSHKRKALETASRHFDSGDALTVHHLEAIYGQESSFGISRRKRGMKGAAGDFQLEKATAVRMGLTVSKENDQRFDVDDASVASAKYLKTLDGLFSKRTALGRGIKTTPVSSKKERVKSAVAAFNGGEGRIARAQKMAQAHGANPEKWEDVAKYLRKAGASSAKVKEITEYVNEVLESTEEFSKKSKADKSVKNKKPKKIDGSPKGGHWITKDGRHILIRN